MTGANPLQVQTANRQFLTSFHNLTPDWASVGFDPTIADLPALRWKLLNLERLRSENPAKFADQLQSLDACLGAPKQASGAAAHG